MTPKESFEAVEERVFKIWDLKNEINAIVSKSVPDFHFLSHSVLYNRDDFWSCDESPAGVCVFKREFSGYGVRLVLRDCIFCGQPTERK